MRVELINEFTSGLPLDDDHPYRSGAWLPNTKEIDAFELPVTGELPGDLSGVYLRNTENPLHDAIGRYHPFDGDGMLHSLFVDNGELEYRNRFIRTEGFNAELEAGRPLWAGLIESPKKSLRAGCGARTGLKDASSTDVVVHGGRAATSFYQCGDVYELHPRTLEQLGKSAWVRKTTPGWGISAHTKVDQATGEMLFFNYSKQAPFMHYGVVNAERALVHYVPIPLPGPRLPHDMAFTDNYAILNDFPLYWDAQALRVGAHAVRFHPNEPSRFGIIPRRGAPDQIRWFEARPTFVLHFINAYEDGDAVVLDGFFEENPQPNMQAGTNDKWSIFRMLNLHEVGAKAYRWRFDLKTGRTTEGYLDDAVLEFGMINPAFAGKPYRYTWAATMMPEWFLMNGLVRLDVQTGEKQSYALPEGVFLSESPMAPRNGATEEDDGYVLTFVTDLNNNSSSALIFAAEDIARGPVAEVGLPQRICAGTHACWSDKRHLG